MQKIETAMVVIGGGGAGLAAAMTAHQAGVSNIVVLEKSHYFGGNSRMAGGQLFAVETPDQFASGKVMYKDDVFRETMQFHHYSRIEPKILRTFLENGPDTVAWLEDMGFRYRNDEGTNYLVDYTLPFGNFIKVTNYLRDTLRAGGHTLLRDTQVTGLHKTETGWLVEAEGPEGSLTAEAKTVVLATGGFVGNSQLLHRYFPDQYDDNYYTDALPLMGDGIELARQAGAALADYCTIIKENAYSCDSYKGAPNRAGHQPASLWVNARGERFHDETNTMNESTNALVRQPGKIGFALFDQKVLDFAASFRPFGMPEDMELPNVREQLAREAARSGEWVRFGDTIEDLAVWMGAEPETLKATVEEYNADCDAGRDSLFAKDPKFLIPLREGPFCAIKFRPILIDTAGPVIVDHRTRVLGADHKPVEGLYAAGVITSGWQGHDYHLHGCALSYSVTSGRLAGKEIAQYLQK